MRIRTITLSLFVSFFLLLPGILLAAARIVDFHARRETGRVVLEWTTEEETNLERFIIQRNTDKSNNNWTKIGEVKSKSGNSSTRQTYTFADESVFKNNTSTFYYRLIMKDKNGQTTPYDVIVSITGCSGIKHTWGTIKAMFR